MDKLRREIEVEKDYIQETLKYLDEALNRSVRTQIELSATGSFLHHIYNCTQ